MTTIQAGLTYYKQVNEKVREAAEKDDNITIENVIGQRYIGCGSSGKNITVHGTPGNGLGQYLNGSTLEVFGNAQEAVGDTMNEGDIIIHGNVGYRGGIHMKAYQEHFPVVVIGGKAGSFLGEYQAGGLILVLGIGQNGAYPVNNFCGTGMHGGKIVLRCDKAPTDLPRQVLVSEVSADDMTEFAPYIKEYAQLFGADAENLLSQKYFVLTPNPEAGYKQLYTFEA